jgi:hypothetical protein
MEELKVDATEMYVYTRLQTMAIRNDEATSTLPLLSSLLRSLSNVLLPLPPLCHSYLLVTFHPVINAVASPGPCLEIALGRPTCWRRRRRGGCFKRAGM